MKKTKKNFTLVELLCATAIVVILAGIGFSAYSYASHRGKEAATRSLITRLEAGLETLKTKHGVFPVTSNESAKRFARIVVKMDSNGIIKEIKFMHKTDEVAAISDAKQLKDFLAVVDAENIKAHLVNDSGDYYFLTDSWGGKIYYAHPGFFNKIKFDLLTPGADSCLGKDGKEVDNKKEDEIPDTLTSYTIDKEWACDDIAIFK
jgi:prepilin-type N-terminal cleavage/methylation domain-containing protein